MSRKNRFILLLEDYLKKNNIKNKKQILTKYEKLIDEKLKNGKKITKILKELGSVEEILLKEQENNKFDFFHSILETFKNIRLFDKVKKLILKINELNPYIEKIEQKETESIFKNKEKVKNFSRKRKILHYIYGFLLNLGVIVSAFALIWTTTVFVASLFMLLDGVKLIGVPLLLFSILILLCWALILLNKILTYRKVEFRKTLYTFLAIIILVGVSLGLVFIQIYKFERVNDVSVKYSLNTVEKVIDLSSDSSKKYYIHFNSWYKNKYIIHYDEELENKIKIKIDFYECFYDLNYKKSVDSSYISLKRDHRDLISFYIENLKDKKIYDVKELSRNIVNIYINESDYERLVIID